MEGRRFDYCRGVFSLSHAWDIINISSFSKRGKISKKITNHADLIYMLYSGIPIFNPSRDTEIGSKI